MWNHQANIPGDSKGELGVAILADRFHAADVTVSLFLEVCSIVMESSALVPLLGETSRERGEEEREKEREEEREGRREREKVERRRKREAEEGGCGWPSCRLSFFLILCEQGR
jgi:hypothetical protein